SVDIASFLEGDEIAFVTGIGLKQPGVKAVPELVRAIYDHGASAIVLNEGPYIPAIPESVRSFCDDVALPLFQVPWDV
ncbi:PucR family transcriptional regulator ligand-binding domain-containing protein, partial [Acinetobacter baumannii]|uniref:PucR family transcriptional regulator ligand-binding domain-containing protein n=1 Tax=Acinetobacter baumannii TaxID=470 RepID=UPI00331FA75D